MPFHRHHIHRDTSASLRPILLQELLVCCKTPHYFLRTYVQYNLVHTETAPIALKPHPKLHPLTFLPHCWAVLCVEWRLLGGLQLLQEGPHVEGLWHSRPLGTKELPHHLQEGVHSNAFTTAIEHSCVKSACSVCKVLEPHGQLITEQRRLWSWIKQQ